MQAQLSLALYSGSELPEPALSSRKISSCDVSEEAVSSAGQSSTSQKVDVKHVYFEIILQIKHLLLSYIEDSVTLKMKHKQ